MKTFTNCATKAKQFLNLLQGYTKGIRITAILILLLMGVGNAWGLGYNNESHVYLDVNGTTKYYKVSSESWSTGCSLPGTWGGELKNQTFNDVQNLTIKGGAVGGWTNSGEKLSATLSYAVTTNTNTPSSWTNFGSVSSDHTTYSGNNAFYYKNDGSTDVTPTTPGTYYLHIKIAFNSTSKTSYAKFTIPKPPTYTVAGSEAVLGSSWDQSDTNNDMTLSSGTTYTLTKQNVYLTNGNYECKVVQDHNWEKAWPNNNYSFTVPTTGHYDVTFTFNSSNKSIEVTTTRLYALTYDGNGSTSGSVPTTEYHKSGTNITVANNSGNLIKSGHTFEGWNDKTDGTGTSYAVGSTFSMPSADKTLYAKWTENVTTHTVTYGVHSSGNGTLTAKAGSTSINSGTKVNQGSSITFTANPSTGYEVAGWYSNSECTSAIAGASTSKTYTINSLAAAATVYVKFQGKKYTVTLSNQSATTAGTASVQATYGSAMPSATMPTKTGYTFGGYYTSNNGGGTQYYTANGASARTWNIAENTTLYAKWTANQYTITYKDQNNANFSGSHASGYPTKHTYGTATTLKTATKTGYTFDGWHTDAACTNKVTSLGATAYTADITLYAKWTATPTTIYLKPSANWKQANARFAIYAFGGGSGDKWVDMTPIGCNDEYYMADVPAGYSQFKFVRLNPNADNYGWDNDVAWGQTDDLSIQNDGDNLWDMTKKMHLNIGSWSENSSGRFAAYFFEQGKDGNWVSMFKGNDNNVYYCDIPNGTYTHLILCRMDPGNSTNAWNNNSVWHQTGDIPLGVDNYYTITSWGTDGKNCSADGSYIMVGEWTKLDLPKITITNSNPTYGNITVTTVGGTTITSGMEVDWDTQVIVSVQPKAGYAVKSSSIDIGGNAETIQSGKTYTICNSTTISVSFEERQEYYIIGMNDDWSTLKEEYKFTDGRVLLELDGKITQNFKIAAVKGGSISTRYGQFTFKGLYPSGGLKESNGAEGDHCAIETVHDGDYLFVWDENTKKLTIEYPDVIFLHGSFNDWKDKPSHALHNQDAKVYLTGNNTPYEFKIAAKGVYWTRQAHNTTITTSGTITMDDNTDYGNGPDYHNCKITASITGLYTFHFDKETRILTITYPTNNTLANGDYRLYYTGSPANHFSDHVKKQTNGRDTVSLFIKATEGTPTIKLQKYNGSNWTDVSEEKYNVSNITSIKQDEHMYNGDGVWNFIITQVNEVAKVAIDETHRYTGDYYIRTDAAGGGWNEYQTPENQMFFSSYARDNENFDHYFCKYITSNTNVKFNVANDYSSQLCATDCDADELNNTNGSMKADGNVRFMYFSKTNTLGRAYLDGSSTDNFLRITNATNLYDADGKNSITTAKFTDLQNWIYQVDVQATGNSKVKLEAIYNGNTQYFKGGTDQTVPLLASTSNDKHKIRLIYNFKTNHLVCAWLAAGETIDGNNQTLGADMMLIRKNQNLADQLHFNPNTNTLSDVKNAYAVMTFTEDFIKNEEKTIYERALYWVSFPYDVLISQVFGFGEYGEHWIMQYYDGAARAEKGLFSDSGTYWKYITNTKTILEKGKGYVLALDLDKVKKSFIHGIESVSLYFPSNGELGIIQGDDPTAVDVPEHKCNINLSNDPDGNNKDRRDRRIYDSHWNMIGVPRFADIKEFNTNNELAPVTYSADSLSFYYEYLPKTDKYQTRIVTADFQAMYGYMVQFAGTINWTEKNAIKPAQLAARRNADNTEPEKVSLRLEIAQDEEMADQTFVQLQQEGATAEFDMNLDLTKMFNSGANIYTLAGKQRIQSAGNALPMEEVVVPVGVKVDTDGEYTFRMPDGTEGMVVELIDYELETTTNLLLFDYTVTLPKGTSEGRFALHIQPSKSGVTTNIDQIKGGSMHHEGVQKYLIDGQLYIVREGVVYDAQGHRL